MVGPPPAEESRLARRRIAVGFVSLVALSAGLIALRVDPSPVELVVAVGTGAVVGVALVWYVGRLVRQAGRRG